MQEVRVSLRYEEMTRIANEREEHRLMLKAYALSIKEEGIKIRAGG